MRNSAILVFFLAVFSACSVIHQILPSNWAAKKVSGTRPANRSDIRIMTWNTGLAPGLVSRASVRQPFVVEALVKSDADVICLQEVWTDTARDVVVSALETAGYETYVADTAGENETGKDRCEAGETRALGRCVESRCGGYPAEDQAVCAVKKCRKAIERLYFWHRPCLNCVLSSVGGTSLEIERRCVEGPASRLYGGNNGVILASRLPLEEQETVRLKSSGANRVALLARVRFSGGAAVELGCVQLSGYLEVSPTEEMFDNWEEESEYQLRAVARRLALRAGGAVPQILVGNLNFAAAHPPWNEKEMVGARELAGELWFRAPAEDVEPAICTWCRGNILAESGRNCLLDQAMVRQPANGRRLVAVAAWRDFTYRVTVRDRRGWETTVNLSDHYGLYQDFVFDK